MAKAYVNKRDKFLWDNSFKPEDKIPVPSVSDEGKAIVVDDDGNYALDDVGSDTIYFDLRIDTSDSTLTVTDTKYTVAEINTLARAYNTNILLRVQYDETDVYRLFRLYRVEDWITKWNDTVSSAEDGVITINTDSINMQNNGTVRFYRRTLNNTPYNYSTTERIVGTWIDGKPLYEKTFITTVIISSRNTWYNADDVTALHVKELIHFESTFGSTGHTIVTNVVCGQINNNYIQVMSLEPWGINSYTIRYTKTTD